MKNAAEYIFDCLKKVDQRNLSVRHIVLVPDRASLEAERQLLSSLCGSFNIQILTMRRFANRVLPQFKYLTKQSGIIALSAIISENKKNLSCYTKGADTLGFAENIYETISRLKYCKIPPEKLFSNDLPKSVKSKLSDIGILYGAYQNFLAGTYVDSADKLELLTQAIETDESVKNSFFYLYDFDNLSAQEFAIVEKLVRFSKGVTVATCFSDDKYDKYLYLNDIYDGVLTVCQNAGVSPNIIDFRKHTNEYAKQIGKYLYSFRTVKPIESNGFVEIFEGSTRVQEVYALACKVQQFVRNGGRFRDVYAITSDLEKYTNAIKTVFAEFEIPYYCDRQFCLGDHIFSQFILDYFLMLKNNLQLTEVLSFVKNYFFSDGESQIYLFENYCLKYNVSYNFSEFALGKHENELFSGAESVRQNLMRIVSAIAAKPADSARNFVDAVKKLCVFCGLSEKNRKFALRQQSEGLAFESKVTAQVEEKISNTLMQIEDILGDKEISLDNFLKILKTALSAVNISAIPLYSDCVVFANMAKARKHDIKFLALLGANQGQMPILKGDSQLLNDANLVEMNNCGLPLEPQTAVENRRERFSLFQLLQEPDEKLYVSYTATDGKDNLLPSPFVRELCKIFSEGGKPLSNCSKTDEDVYTRRQAVSKLVLNKRRLRDNQPVKMPFFETLYTFLHEELQDFEFSKDYEAIRVSDGKSLFLQKKQTSVSKVTDFFKCPYLFFLHYGLKIAPRVEASLESKELGSILHNVLELYVKNMKDGESDEQTKKSASKLFEVVLEDDFLKGLNNDSSMKNILRQLKNEAVKMCLVVKEQLKNSEFKNIAAEFNFGGNGGGKSVDVAFGEDGFSLVGKVDRVDACDGKFFVIDYKSGADTFSEKELYIGQKLQLLVYLKAVAENFKLEPVGFYYFNMHNKFVSESEKKVYTYSGRTINDLETAKKIDTKLRTGDFSEKLGLSLKKDGQLSKTPNLVSKEQIKSETEYALRLIANAGSLMSKGYIAVKPYEKVCDYCDFKDICDFNDVLRNEPRKETAKISAETIDAVTTGGKI